MRLLLLSLCLLEGTVALAHDGEHRIDEIVVKGQLIRPENSAYSATAIGQETIRQHSYSNTDDLFRLVPGMAVRNFQLGGVANSIVIRGFGGGGHGGDLGAVIDGIPLNEANSHADGYVDLNVLVPLEIESFTVFKGPVSALYGNFNRGGLLNIQTRKSGTYTEADVAFGTDGLIDVQGAAGGKLGDDHQFNIAAQYAHTDGFRPQSEAERMTLAGRWSFAIADSVELALSGRVHKADADSASYLLYEQFKREPDGKDPRVEGDGAEKNFSTLRADLNVTLSEHLKLLNFVYTTQQDFTRWFTRPINASTWRQREETYDRAVYGAGSNLNGRTDWGTVPVAFVAGIETFRESTDFGFYEGSIDRRRTAPAVSDRESDLNSLSAFTEINADLHPLAQLSIGLRGDRFTGGCELNGPETGTDPCSSLNRAERLSPKIGLRSQITDHVQLRGSWAEGFALPNGFIKYSVGGQPLDENVFRQTEIGVRAEVETFNIDVAAFRLTSTDEVRTVAPGLYENFGETLRRGVEASIGWKPVRQLDLRALVGWTDTEVEENATPALEGKQVAGVPRNTATLEMDFAPVERWTFSAAWRYVGSYQIDAPNTLEADSSAILDIGLAYTGNAPAPYRVYSRIENVTDREYVTSETLIGGQRAIAPGAPLSARVGIQLDF